MPGLVSTLLNHAGSMPGRLVQTFLQVTEQVWQPMHLSRLSTMPIWARTFMLEVLRSGDGMGRWRHGGAGASTGSARTGWVGYYLPFALSLSKCWQGEAGASTSSARTGWVGYYLPFALSLSKGRHGGAGASTSSARTGW